MAPTVASCHYARRRLISTLLVLLAVEGLAVFTVLHDWGDAVGRARTLPIVGWLALVVMGLVALMLLVELVWPRPAVRVDDKGVAFALYPGLPRRHYEWSRIRTAHAERDDGVLLYLHGGGTPAVGAEWLRSDQIDEVVRAVTVGAQAAGAVLSAPKYAADRGEKNGATQDKTS